MTQNNNSNDTVSILTKKDFVSDQMVKWCPGCGDHSILASLENVLPKLGKKKEDIVVVSGIGCSSRFPYYVNTYGFHGIHGRALPIACGIKMANPNLSVWVTTGDGDSLAIGGNHFIHTIRRNFDVNLILFNNKIYGLTKGQYSPTTPLGQITKTSPYGTIDEPFNPGELVIGAKGTFFARVTDKNPKYMSDIMYRAAQHKGTSILEVLQNCVIFNNGAHNEITDKDKRDDNQLILEHGKPMLFGKNKEKGIRINGTKLQAVTLGENGITIDDILVHDEKEEDPSIHFMLARMHLPELPVAIGVIRDVDSHTYEDMLYDQIEERKVSSPYKCVDDLLNSGDTWEIK
ncbi:MAG: 2-oxoacid:ferredoxin oxidoreductase subunit beta [Bacteroidales bacterium]|nr:2-oxoacid:ferredoxin oxidoreductase subunit beta [Bacteroidales bacterium]